MDVHLHLVSISTTRMFDGGLGAFQVHETSLRMELLKRNQLHWRLVISIDGICLGLPADVTTCKYTPAELDSTKFALTPKTKKSYEVEGFNPVTLK